jgi:hypothetical protein
VIVLGTPASYTPTLTTSAATIGFVRGTLGAIGVLVKAFNAATAVNLITWTAAMSADGVNLATGMGANAPLTIATGDVPAVADGTNIMFNAFYRSATAPFLFIPTPYVRIQGVQATAGGLVSVLVYPIFDTQTLFSGGRVTAGDYPPFNPGVA